MVLVEGWSPFVSEARVGVIGRPDWRASGTLIESSKEAATTALRENETEGRTCCLKIGVGKVRQKVGPEVSKWRGAGEAVEGAEFTPLRSNRRI